MTFSSLKLNQNLTKTLTDLGYDEPTPIQAQAIPAILSGQDIMGRAQTGTGKTAAFALPILQRLEQHSSSHKAVRALVLTPTRELAQQVHGSFEKYSKNSPVSIAIAYGGASIKTQVEALEQNPDVLVATPGRLLDHLHKGSLTLKHLQFLVFDEADRMLDMGFKDEINRILKRLPQKRQTLLFSATFDQSIFNLAKHLLNDAKRIEVDEGGNIAAQKVEQVFYAVDKDRKRELISHMIGAKNWQQVLIFVRTRQGADALAKQMTLDGIKTESIHSDKSQGARDKALLAFKQGDTRALIATDVASRGIDIEQLQYVFNYELPFNAEDYIHRIGRTGRAGQAGLAISLVSQDENPQLQAIEKLLDTRLTAQWLPGYEPDLTKVADNGRPNDKAKFKRKAKGRGRRR